MATTETSVPTNVPVDDDTTVTVEETTKQPEEEGTSSYLPKVPEAYSFLRPQKTEEEREIARRDQAKIVSEKMTVLSKSNRSVTFELDAALDTALLKELVEKRYQVATSDVASYEDGHETTSHKVLIKIPSDVDAYVNQESSGSSGYNASELAALMRLMSGMGYA